MTVYKTQIKQGGMKMSERSKFHADDVVVSCETNDDKVTLSFAGENMNEAALITVSDENALDMARNIFDVLAK